MNAALAKSLADALGVGDLHCREAGGGCISRGMVAACGEQRWFVKLNDASRFPMFEAEADGLAALAACTAFRVPQCVALGQYENTAWFALDYLDLKPLRSSAGGEAFGRALACLHRITSTQFGWPRANFIGSTPQYNQSESNWPLFYAKRRLKPQLEMAQRNGASSSLVDSGERLCERIGSFFERLPVPSLLHGDLWGGNAAVDDAGKPAIFDPAVYYGDREADLAMTELFGGFPPSFYAAYREAWPLEVGYERRRTLYNLYHVLNHFNLFGGAYEDQAEQMMRSLL